MKSLISFFTLTILKGLSNIFYKYKTGWPKGEPVRWDNIKLIVLLNHTSLLEVLYVGIMPVSFLRRMSKRLVVPIASKTIARPVVGFLFKIFSHGTMAISRKRDDSWNQFVNSIYDDSIILIIPEGRMKRRTGLDLDGKKMNVKPGVVEILANLKDGQLVFAYSGGLHHVQAPGEGWPNVFKTLHIDLEAIDIPVYKGSFAGEAGSNEWKKNVLDDMQHRLETKPPVMESETLK